MATSSTTPSIGHSGADNRVPLLVALLGLAFVAWLAAPMVGFPRLAWPALAVGLSVVAAYGYYGVRSDRRRQLTVRMQAAVSAELGSKSVAGVLVAGNRWTREWSERPRRIKIRYAPSAGALAPDWPSRSARSAAGIDGGTYRVRRHDAGRGHLDLTLVDDPSADPTRSVHEERARRVIGDLIGPTTAVKTVDVDDSGHVTAIEVSHSAGAKLAGSGYRARIERTVSSLLPGRWRAQWDMEADRVRFEVRPSLPDCIWLEEVKPRQKT